MPQWNQSLTQPPNYMNKLRPSILPKLAACPCFENSGVSSDAAERGTRMDTAFRLIMSGTPTNVAYNALKPDEIESVQWAVERVCLICGGEKVLVSKESCTLDPWCDDINGGEADGICLELNALFDLKSGQVRNYWEQQASYALSLMTDNFSLSWTCYLLFCDQQIMETKTFTYDEAREMCLKVVAEQKSAQPRLCEYCSWCAKTNTCALRTQVAKECMNDIVSAHNNPNKDYLSDWFDNILADPELVSKFLNASKVIEEFAEQAKSKAGSYLLKGIDVPGYTRISCKGKNTVNPTIVGHYIKQMGFDSVLQEYGAMPEGKFRKIWTEKMGATPYPDSEITIGAGYSYIKKGKSTNQKLYTI